MVDGPAVADGLFAAVPALVQAQREADEMLDHDSPLEELFEEQIGCADMVVVNKTDLLDAEALDRAMAAVRRELRPGARIVRAVQGAVARSEEHTSELQ